MYAIRSYYVGRTEEFLDHGGHRLRVDQVVRHQRLDVLQAHLLPDRPFDPDQPHPELVLDQLPDGADPAVSEVVDIVRLARITSYNVCYTKLLRSMITRVERPVTSSTCSRIVTPSMMSPNLIPPVTSVRIGML